LINQLLNIITACILNITIIHIVIPHFGKCSKFCLSCLILGIDGFGLFLVALFLVSHFAHVGCDIKGVVTKMSLVHWPQCMGWSRSLDKNQPFILGAFFSGLLSCPFCCFLWLWLYLLGQHFERSDNILYGLYMVKTMIPNYDLIWPFLVILRYLIQKCGDANCMLSEHPPILICNWYLERFSTSKFNKNTSITKYWLCSKLILYVWWFWSVKELSIAKIIMSLGTTVEWLGGILICNWYLERFSISKFSKNTSITKYWLCS
jgi:hypothetical protein